jgi:hypothetical protein
MIKQYIGLILAAALLGAEPASASSQGAGRMPGQSQRSVDSGYCPGTQIHVYHLSACAHYDRAGKHIPAPPTKPIR